MKSFKFYDQDHHLNPTLPMKEYQPKPTTGEWTTATVAACLNNRLDAAQKIADSHNAALVAEREKLADRHKLCVHYETLYKAERDQLAAEQKMKWELAQQLAAERENAEKAAARAEQAQIELATEREQRCPHCYELEGQLATEREQLKIEIAHNQGLTDDVQQFREQLAAEKGALADMARTNEKLSAMLAAERLRLVEAHEFALKFKQHYPSMKGVDELITICKPKQ